MPSVFLSHVHRDEALAGEIEKQLERLGLSAFNPATEIRAGENWRKSIQKAIRDADAFVLLVASPEATFSSWVSYETGLAEALGKPVIVMLSHDRSSSELPAEIATNRLLQFDPRSPDRAARDIAEELAAA